MMPNECSKLVDAYLAWLKAKIKVSEVNGVCEITTPFLDRHNDRLQIYVQRKDAGLLLTDDGYILSDLETCGCAPETPHRRQILTVILNGYGVRHQDGELIVEANERDFPQKKHALLQAMMTVNDMFLTATPLVRSLFREDVESFLEASGVRYSPDVQFTGKSGFVQKFDFLIPKSPQKPERILRAINKPDRDNTTALIFAWSDTRDVRPANSIAYAVLNDMEKEVSPDVASALHQYDVKTILWSQRGEYVEELAA